jgi:hypothetical protein
MFQRLHRHPFFFGWQGRLEEIVTKYREHHRKPRT